MLKEYHMNTTTILIVDDENLTRRALIQGIHWDELGIDRVLDAGSAAQAKEMLKSEQIDLVLTDIEMPVESGLELVAWIKENIDGFLPCAFLTCHASFNYAKEAVHLGSFDYMLKPVDFEEVEELILRMTNRSRIMQEHKRMDEYGHRWLREKEEAGKQYEKSPASTEEIIDRAIDYIRSHLSEKLSLSDLSHEAGLNPNYFNKVFKERAGDTVNQFIIKEKMGLAAQLLMEGNLKSYAIALSLGYDNYANFVNMFKKTYGMSPNAYAEENRRV